MLQYNLNAVSRGGVRREWTDDDLMEQRTNVVAHRDCVGTGREAEDRDQDIRNFA